MAVNVIKPGSTIGILGSGQLGRMLAQSAARHGYHAMIFGPEPDAPAYEVSASHITAEYGDEEALVRFAQAVDVVTVEFENVPARALEIIAEHAPIRPGTVALHTCQNRAREKQFLREQHLPHARTVEIASSDDEKVNRMLEGAYHDFGKQLLVKTAGFGYDGKGQVRVANEAQLQEALALAQEGPVVVEQFLDLLGEFSIIIARGIDGATAAFEPIVNEHVNQILDTSFTGVSRFGVPDGDRGELLRLLDAGLAHQGRDIAEQIVAAFDYVGLLAVEFFVSRDGALYVNEIAPRTHNSGHLTMEACDVSQFDLQLRALCGLPLHDQSFTRAAAMTNVLGDSWEPREPDWAALLENGGTFLHLYGKHEARPGRKMGHITRVGQTLPDVL